MTGGRLRGSNFLSMNIKASLDFELRQFKALLVYEVALIIPLDVCGLPGKLVVSSELF
jgi:hypothetical protein